MASLQVAVGQSCEHRTPLRLLFPLLRCSELFQTPARLDGSVIFVALAFSPLISHLLSFSADLFSVFQLRQNAVELALQHESALPAHLQLPPQLVLILHQLSNKLLQISILVVFCPELIDFLDTKFNFIAHEIVDQVSDLDDVLVVFAGVFVHQLKHGVDDLQVHFDLVLRIFIRNVVHLFI